MKSKLLWRFLCMVSGIAMGLCLLYPQFGPAVFVLAVPALVAIQQQTTKKHCFFACALFTAGFCGAAYFPAFSITVNMEPHYEFWIDLAVYLVLILVHGGILAFSLWLGYQCKVPGGFRAVWVALCWAGAEWLLGFGAFAWPTARVSLALWQYPLFFRSASLGGQLLVAALIFTVNGLIARGLFYKIPTKKWTCLAAAVALFLANLSFGLAYPAPASATTSVAVVQPGGQAVNANRGTVYADCFSLAQQAALENPDLIVLPEGILPSRTNNDPTVQAQWGNVAKQGNADLLVGGFRDGISTVIQFDVNGNRKTEYQKIKEVPFFENGQGKDFTFSQKKHSSVLKVNCGSLGNLICYESMFPSLARNSVKDGANLLFVSTNDSWFTANMAKDIHLAHGVYRAVETGRALVQSSVDGCSAVVDAAGKITDRLPHKTKGVMQAKVSFDPMNTLYNHIGDWWLILGMVTILGISFGSKILKREERSCHLFSDVVQ